MWGSLIGDASVPRKDWTSSSPSPLLACRGSYVGAWINSFQNILTSFYKETISFPALTV